MANYSPKTSRGYIPITSGRTEGKTLMEYNGASLESILARLSFVLESQGDGCLEPPAIPYTINQLLETAIDNRASLLHINVGCPPMLRINAQLVPIGEHQLTRGDCQKLLYPLLTKEQRVALYSGQEIEGCFPASGTGFRLNVYKERGNISASIRRLRTDLPTLDSLGLANTAVEQAVLGNAGLVLLTGSPRCGKINTLASLVNFINTRRHARIITLEKPIQFWHQNATGTVIQREVGVDTQSFARGIQQAVVQDPDVIALSDLPDRETAEYAIRAAAGGHLVLAALDASSPVRALERLVTTFSDDDSGPKALSTFAGCLSLVIGQTLIPHRDGQHTIPAFELLNGSNAVRQELSNGQVDRLYSIMQDENMVTLGRALGALVSAGTITRDTALEYVSSAEELESPSAPAAAPETQTESESQEQDDTPLMSWL